jgi:hypothetical protein
MASDLHRLRRLIQAFSSPDSYGPVLLLILVTRLRKVTSGLLVVSAAIAILNLFIQARWHHADGMKCRWRGPPWRRVPERPARVRNPALGPARRVPRPVPS